MTRRQTAASYDAWSQGGRQRLYDAVVHGFCETCLQPGDLNSQCPGCGRHLIGINSRPAAHHLMLAERYAALFPDTPIDDSYIYRWVADTMPGWNAGWRASEWRRQLKERVAARRKAVPAPPAGPTAESEATSVERPHVPEAPDSAVPAQARQETA